MTNQEYMQSQTSEHVTSDGLWLWRLVLGLWHAGQRSVWVYVCVTLKFKSLKLSFKAKQSHSPTVYHTSIYSHTRGHNPNSMTCWPFSQMKHSTDQQAHQPTPSSSLLKSQQLHLTCNINNLIYFHAPSLSLIQPTTHTQVHKYTEGSAHSHSLIFVCRKCEPRSIR